MWQADRPKIRKRIKEKHHSNKTLKKTSKKIYFDRYQDWNKTYEAKQSNIYKAYMRSLQIANIHNGKEASLFRYDVIFVIIFVPLDIIFLYNQDLSFDLYYLFCLSALKYEIY